MKYRRLGDYFHMDKMIRRGALSLFYNKFCSSIFYTILQRDLIIGVVANGIGLKMTIIRKTYFNILDRMRIQLERSPIKGSKWTEMRIDIECIFIVSSIFYSLYFF